MFKNLLKSSKLVAECLFKEAFLAVPLQTTIALTQNLAC